MAGYWDKPNKGTSGKGKHSAPVGRSPNGGAVLTPGTFEEAHKQSDVDTEVSAQHHTLGKSPNQAYPGNAFSADFLEAFNAAFPGALNAGVVTTPLVYSGAFLVPGGYSPPRLVKIGALVLCRGTLQNTSGVGQTGISLATYVPSGWRPSALSPIFSQVYGIADNYNTLNAAADGSLTNNVTVPNTSIIGFNGFWVTGF